ncbi:MAG: NPCBM/NEW2 domain-containing protein [Sedimentisphaerales bacterium]|nr:NPCBM/NEW2 domain-containing protein [Sedimentisphaerales bacterium]
MHLRSVLFRALIIVLAFILPVQSLFSSESTGNQDRILLIVRGDDIGSSHTANIACIKSCNEGIVQSLEVMVPTPWFNEAAKMLRENPGIDVGVHLTLTSEWENMKWGPLTQSPSLVDANGHFYPMTSQRNDFPPNTGFLQCGYKLEEVEAELRAQIELAMKEIPQVTHLSSHMGAPDCIPPLRAIVEKLAQEYKLGYKLPGVKSAGGFWPGPKSPEEKEQILIEIMEKLQPGTYLFLEHPGLDTPEMRAIGHKGYEDVAADRTGVTYAFTSSKVKETIHRRGIKLISYGDFYQNQAIKKSESSLKTCLLSNLNLSKMKTGWGPAKKNLSIIDKPLTLNGNVFEHGIGSHANSVMYIQLDGRARRFTSLVGVDDETEGKGSVQFKVYGDKKKIFESPVIKGRQEPVSIDLPLEGVKQLILVATNGGDDISYDHADWADAKISYEGQAPVAIDIPQEEPVLLTPKPGPEPRLNNPVVYGARPGRPFLYRIPATGRRPMEFGAENLPSSLTLDAKKGIITGTTPRQKGEYEVIIHVKNASGQAQKAFTIVVGDTLALTPPMGWNDWYSFYDRPTDKLMRTAADIIIDSGMADFGYQYVNIDDCWMIKVGSNDPIIGGELRDKDGVIRPNQNFPDMTALTDYIHSKGLKAGLYTSPGPTTCAGYVGTYQYEELDALTFAKWGFDFLKYDWCSYERVATGQGLERAQRPYRKMGEILSQLPRDIVYNLCQYGMNDVWTWGAEVGGNCWRTTGDLGLERATSLPGFYSIGLSNAKHCEYAKPGGWNDPDYILIGYVGNAWQSDQPPKPCGLTPNEQYSYMSMWCLMAAPLFYSGDITQLDDFTLNVLCNAEVIEVDQDPLGQQARVVHQNEEELIMCKSMADGSLVIGMFDLGEVGGQITVSWEQLQIEGKRRIRDLWRQKDTGIMDTEITSVVSRHGVTLIRLFPIE